ncbi:alpha/beta fold hydrolase [Saccharomonospora viridis]|jgi:pimeloyl-ACP methyl ester carboxylesterase|uniref:Predicted hydrolase or acyltransferase of alpha/beta superfamily n=2 Tax=Saccharomonospora viridis TaxID=1852 RepID=C7MRJ7_SACVD|nr:alpha/beta hydrolase family protein [Saccharomonospora viridis]ACU98783.1 predicted hydrolase or acyltransferase of alpha/beta superfamily [Saccharomonospora viridis DSM 43017]KHF44577.1 alpha/beta hydrolase [Saccharomonospora viridis]SFP25526.1 Pimeloyl-ACP methyl ester carboxylesterase [Saccharomonospora viridis]
MSTFVLVHGAWHGGWCWDRVTPFLREAGHDVYTPTLTGLSERSHLLSPLVGLDTHIEDVVRLITVLGLRDVVLVGHSYAGQVISGVADRCPDAIARRVYLDAFVGDDGERARDLLPEEVAHHWASSAEEQGFGWLVPVRKLSVLGVTDQADVDWLQPKLTPHPWKTYTDPLRLTGAGTEVPATFIECVDWMRVFRAQADRAREQGWPVHELNTGHEAMVTAPKALADLLLECAGK